MRDKGLFICRLFLFLVFSSCLSNKKTLEKNTIEIIEVEFSRVEMLYDLKKEKVYLDFNLNDYMLSLFQVQEGLNPIELELGKELYNTLFNTKDVVFLNMSKNKIVLPKNVYYKNVNRVEKEIFTLSNTLVNYSSPIFIKDRYCIVGFAFGSSGGVNLYTKENGEWVYKRSFDGWVE